MAQERFECCSLNSKPHAVKDYLKGHPGQRGAEKLDFVVILSGSLMPPDLKPELGFGPLLVLSWSPKESSENNAHICCP